MGYGARRGVLVKKFFLCLLFVLMLGTAGYMVVLGQRYTARKESSFPWINSAAVGEMDGAVWSACEKCGGGYGESGA